MCNQSSCELMVAWEISDEFDRFCCLDTFDTVLKIGGRIRPVTVGSI